MLYISCIATLTAADITTEAHLAKAKSNVETLSTTGKQAVSQMAYFC